MPAAARVEPMPPSLYYGFFLLALIFIFSVLAKTLAGKSVSDMTYLVLRETLNLNSVHQSILGMQHEISSRKKVC